jgi:NADH-quinone oxidoreductase E subunit
MLSAEARKKIRSLTEVYETHESALIPALHAAQEDQGWLSAETQREVAQLLGLTPQLVRQTVTFYTMFHQKPVGRHLLQVCRNLSCTLLGGQRLQDRIQEKLGIADGETTQDGRFTFVSVECLGSCGTAPVLMVNDRYHESVSGPDLDRLLDELK